MQIENPRTPVKFITVKIGDTFIYDDQLCMRIPMLEDEECWKISAINLLKGYPLSIGTESLVIPQKMKIKLLYD